MAWSSLVPVVEDSIHVLQDYAHVEPRILLENLQNSGSRGLGARYPEFGGHIQEPVGGGAEKGLGRQIIQDFKVQILRKTIHPSAFFPS